MKKFLIILSLFLLISFSASASSKEGYLQFGAGPELTLKIYHTENNTTSEINPSVYSESGGTFFLSGGYMVNSLFGIGAATGFSYNGTEIGDNYGTFTIPLYLDFVIRPSVGRISFPFSIGIGGYGQIANNSVAFGPSARVTAGIACDVAENASIGLYASSSLYVQFAHGLNDVTYQVNMTPISMLATIYF